MSISSEVRDPDEPDGPVATGLGVDSFRPAITPFENSLHVAKRLGRGSMIRSKLKPLCRYAQRTAIVVRDFENDVVTPVRVSPDPLFAIYSGTE